MMFVFLNTCDNSKELKDRGRIPFLGVVETLGAAFDQSYARAIRFLLKECPSHSMEAAGIGDQDCFKGLVKGLKEGGAEDNIFGEVEGFFVLFLPGPFDILSKQGA